MLAPEGEAARRAEGVEMNRRERMEFNLAFLLALRSYPFAVMRELLRECREEIKDLGWEEARRRWERFVSTTTNNI